MDVSSCFGPGPTMRQSLLIIFILATFNAYSQKLDITTLDKSKIQATLLDSTLKVKLLTQFNGRRADLLRKKWTARSFLLSDGKVLIEFYDKQAMLIDNVNDFRKLDRIRFVKNTVDFLKKNISYKIELNFEAGDSIVRNEKPNRLTNLKSDMPEYFDFEVYELSTGQILFLDKSKNAKNAAIYPDLKTLSSDNSTIAEQVYGSEDDEYLMKKLASGDALPDYEMNYYLIYPKYLKDLIKNHKLTLVEQKIYVSNFYGNLYKSENGYYILIDEINQKNGAGDKMAILSLRIYQSLQQVKNAQHKYEEFSNKGVTSEHFYQKISDKYGQRFPEYVSRLIDSLPTLLNIDKEQLSFNSAGIDLVDEVLKWNKANYDLLDKLFPSVIAYYGQCYIDCKKDGKWIMYLDKESNVWIPELKLKDGNAAWDWIHFYKDFYEGPIPLSWAGDWDGTLRNMNLLK
jgi:hypothetical protein